MKSAVQKRVLELEARLAEAEATLDALRNGKVDALMVMTPQGERVFTMAGADRPYRVMVEQMAEGAVTFSGDGTILFCNQRIADLLGVRLETLLGSQIFDYLPLRDRAPFRATLHGVNGTPAITEIVMLKSPKKPFPASISVTTLELGGKEAAYCMVVNDLVERRRLERQVLEVSEREQQRLGQDLHDGLGQTLSGISYLAQNAKNSPKDPELPVKLQRISDLLLHTLTQTRELAKGFYPVELERNGLAFAVRELSTQMESTFRVRCRVVCGKNVERIGAGEPIHLYRIIQESVRNAIRHGKARKILVKIARVGDDAVVSIQSDGERFPKQSMQSTIANSRGMGLKIMQYRAHLVGGSLDIQPGQSGGCRVICSVPLGKRAATARRRSALKAA